MAIVANESKYPRLELTNDEITLKGRLWFRRWVFQRMRLTDVAQVIRCDGLKALSFELRDKSGRKIFINRFENSAFLVEMLLKRIGGKVAVTTGTPSRLSLKSVVVTTMALAAGTAFLVHTLTCKRIHTVNWIEAHPGNERGPGSK